MLSAKQLLVRQVEEAFTGRADMPLMASLEGIIQEEASWRPDENTPSIEEIVRHIAWAKSHYCQQAFGTPMVLIDDALNGDGDSADLPIEFPCGAAFGSGQSPGINGAIDLLKRAQDVFTQCLDSCAEEALDQPIPTHHGKSAANFFWVMLMHDLYHSGQIRTRRTVWRIRMSLMPRQLLE